MDSFHHALSVRFQETYSSQLAEVGTVRCVDINYGISDVNAYLTSVKEYTPKYAEAKENIRIALNVLENFRLNI